MYSHLQSLLGTLFHEVQMLKWSFKEERNPTKTFFTTAENECIDVCDTQKWYNSNCQLNSSFFYVPNIPWISLTVFCFRYHIHARARARVCALPKYIRNAHNSYVHRVCFEKNKNKNNKKEIYWYISAYVCIRKIHRCLSFVLFVHSIEFSVMELIYCRFSNNEYENIIWRNTKRQPNNNKILSSWINNHIKKRNKNKSINRNQQTQTF